jgi:uncharacterized protein YbjT (DUF2867 family)
MADEAQAPAEPPQQRPGEPRRKIAVIGEIPFSGCALVQELCERGLAARVLCPDERAETAVQATVAALPEPQRNVETMRGSLESPGSLEEVMQGGYGVALLSPITLKGRMHRPQTHLDDLRRALAAAEKSGTRKFVYHSALGAHPRSNSRALRDSADAELLMQNSRSEDFCLRTGPLMGPKDDFLTEIIARAKARACCVGVLGYGTVALQPLHVRDMARCCLRFFAPGEEELHPGVYSLAGPETVSELDLLDDALARLGRIKLKFHAPVFVLKLLSGVGGPAFDERVKLLSDVFSTEQNDAPKLSSGVPLRTVKQAQDELLAAGAS